MDNKVFHAPLDVPSVRKTLDIGCGTGIVTHEMATTFPQAQVYGLDLSPVPRVREQLSNIEYIQGNIMEISGAKTRDQRFEDGSFDLVFSRLLIAGMTNWKGYVERCAALTSPGVSSHRLGNVFATIPKYAAINTFAQGFVEMHDIGLYWHGIPLTLTPFQRESMRPHTLSYPMPAHPTDAWVSSPPWITTYQRLLEVVGLDATCGYQLPRLFHEAGLKDIQITRYVYPLNEWEGYTDAEKRVAKHHAKTMGNELPASE